ncbi:MAG: hypothetical protein ACREC6_10880 [Hyphomicrobiaceae bacterium]
MSAQAASVATVVAEPAVQPARYGSGIIRAAANVVRFAVGILFCLTPVTAILVLGWLMRLMQREAAIALVKLHGMSRRRAVAALRADPSLAHLAGWPAWLLGRTPPAGTSRVQRLLQRLAGGFWQNFLQGLAALATLAIATLPFGILLLLGWWAGWENSFNKGYEQAWVGPLVGLAGTLLALVVLSYVPLALAHQAAEARAGAFFEIAPVRRLIGLVRWRHAMLAAATTTAALPLFAAKGLPVFVETIRPGFANLPLYAMYEFVERWHFAATAYLFLALVVQRRWTARVYARAAYMAIGHGGDAPTRLTFARHVVQRMAAHEARASMLPRSTPSRLGAVANTIVLAGIWFSFVAQIFAGQFLNHNWEGWLNQPLFGLPSLPRPPRSMLTIKDLYGLTLALTAKES